MAPVNIYELLLDMNRRLATIEQALQDQSCDRHQKWLGNHERRIRHAEIKLNVLWAAGAFMAGIFTYWIKSKL
jgi:hypothetical protein